jgi:microcystin-dependent protein
VSAQGEPAGFPNINQPLITQGTTSITRPWRQLLLTLWNRTGALQGNQAVPSGTIADFGGPTAPSSWLLCDGSAVSRSFYANLFAAIGTTWGDGDGNTTFNLPNLQGLFTQGQSAATSVAQTGGSASITLSVDQLPEHNHPVVDPGHSHPSVVVASVNTTGTATGAVTSGNTGTATTGITTGNTGTGGAINILPPYAVVIKIIKI